MQNRITYYLSLATTSAFGMFGVVSAFYSEVTKHNWETSGVVVAFDLLGILVTASFSFHNFLAARLLIKKEDEKERE